MLIETVAVEWVRLQELEKNAARYRWLRERGEIFLRIDDKNVYLRCGEPLDKWIDAAIDKEIENATARK